MTSSMLAHASIVSLKHFIRCFVHFQVSVLVQLHKPIKMVNCNVTIGLLKPFSVMVMVNKKKRMMLIVFVIEHVGFRGN